ARELDLAAAMHRRKEVMDLTAGGSDIGRYFQKQEQDESERAPASAVVGSDVYILRLPSFNVRDGSIPWLVRGARGRAVMIIDLRGNRGGAVSVLNELLGQVSSTDIPIGSLRERDSSVAQVAKGAGRDAYDGRLFVLVDSESASASEVFARAIQLANRGTVIGDRTAGAVMISRFWTLEVGSGDNVIFYGTNVTVGDPVMSDGGRLEKTGVEPDFLVLPSAEDLANGRDPALAQALKFAGHPMDADAAGKILPRPPKSL
ncbi:MAG: S41 family peptidase, partial [Steroidobacteraceae bacterium]